VTEPGKIPETGFFFAGIALNQKRFYLPENGGLVIN